VSEEGMAVWPNQRCFLMVFLAVFWPELRNHRVMQELIEWGLRVSALFSSGQGFHLLTSAFPVENLMLVIHRRESEGTD